MTILIQVEETRQPKQKRTHFHFNIIIPKQKCSRKEHEMGKKIIAAAQKQIDDFKNEPGMKQSGDMHSCEIVRDLNPNFDQG